MAIIDQWRQLRRSSPTEFVDTLISVAKLNIESSRIAGEEPSKDALEIVGWDRDERIEAARNANSKELRKILALMKEHGLSLDEATDLYDRFEAAQ